MNNVLKIKTAKEKRMNSCEKWLVSHNLFNVHIITVDKINRKLKFMPKYQEMIKK